jgi:hypothetical protein
LNSGRPGLIGDLTSSAALLEMMLQVGLIRLEPLTPEYFCNDCFDWHDATEETAGVFTVRCVAGTVRLGTRELARWSASRSGFVSWLREKLVLSGATEWKASNVLCYLGDYGEGYHSFPVWLLCGLDRPGALLEASSALARRSPAETGVILASLPNALSNSWPRDSKAILLTELLQIEHGQLTLDLRLLLAQAPTSRRQGEIRGRPSKAAEAVLAIFAQRVRAGEAAPTGLKAEACAIWGALRSRYAEKDCPAVGTIENRIRQPYRAWTNSGFSRDCDLPRK